MKTTDTVSIQIPIKPEFVSIARLTASGVAHRSGFDIDTIEDIKVALSEVLAKIIEKRTSSGRVSMDFLCTEQGLSINIKLLNDSLPALFSDEEDKLALSIISSLMDSFQIEADNAEITMVKNFGKAV